MADVNVEAAALAGGLKPIEAARPANPALPTPAEQQRVIILEQARRKKASEVIPAVAGHRFEMTPVEYQESLDFLLLTDVETTGTPQVRAGTTEATRRTNSENWVRNYKEYIDAINAGRVPNPTAQAAIMSRAEAFIMRDPNFNEAFSLPSPPGGPNRPAIAALLQDKRVSSSLAKQLNDILIETRPEIITLNGELLTAYREYKTVEGERTALDDPITGRIAAIDTAILSYGHEKNDFEVNSTHTSGNLPTSLYSAGAAVTKKEMLRVLDTAPDTDLNTASRGGLGPDEVSDFINYRDARRKVERLESQSTLNSTDQRLLETNKRLMEALERKYPTGFITEYNDLLSDKKKFEVGLRDENENKRVATNELTAKKAEETQKKQEYDGKVKRRTDKSRALEVAIDGAVNKAMQEDIQVRAVNMATEISGTQLDNKQQMVADLLQNRLDVRWMMAAGRRKKKQRVSRKAVQNDLDILLDPSGGPNKIIEKILDEVKADVVAKKNPNVSEAEVDLLKHNTAFMNEQREKVTKALIANTWAARVQVSETTLDAIGITSYGEKAVTDAMKVIEKSKENREAARKYQLLKGVNPFSYESVRNAYGAKGGALYWAAALGLIPFAAFLAAIGGLVIAPAAAAIGIGGAIVGGAVTRPQQRAAAA